MNHKHKRVVNTTTETVGESLKKATKIVAVIITIIALVAGFGFYKLAKWKAIDPNKTKEFSGIAGMAKDDEGNTYVITDSTQTLAKINPEGEIENILTSDGEGFSMLRHLCVGGNGKIYAHDVVVSQGIKLDNEVIYVTDNQFSSWGTLAKICEKPGTVRQAIAGMSPTKDGIRYFVKDSDSFKACNENGELCGVYNYREAEKMIMNITSDLKGKEIFYVTYDGKICKYVDGKDDEVLYNSKDVKGSVPQNIAYDDGKLYVTDIGLRDIIVVDVKTGDSTRREVEDPVKEREVGLAISAHNGLMTASDYSIIFWDGDSYEQVWDVPYSSEAKKYIILGWASAIYLALYVALMLIVLLRYFLKKSNKYTKVAFFILLGVAALVVLFVGTLFPAFTGQLTEQIYEKEILAASVTAQEIPKDSFLALDEPSDFRNEDYMKVKQAIENVFNSNKEIADSLYCVLYRVFDGTVTLTYTMEDTCVVYPYDWEYEGTEMEDLMLNGTTHRYENTDSTGSYLFVHCPINDEEGNPIGFVEVGTDMNSVSEKNREIMISLLLNVFAMTIVVIMLVIEFMYYFRGKNAYSHIKKQKKEDVHLTPEIFRFIVFLIFFFTNLTCVILPIYAVNIAHSHPFFGLSPAITAAIPISAEVLSGAIFSALGGRVIEKLSPKRAILVSSILYTAGLAFRVIPSIPMLTLGAFCLGAGWGVLLILVNVQIAELPDEEKDKGYAYYSVSSISGINCGVVLGGFLVQWFSYSVIFTITAVASIPLYFVCRKYLADNMPDLSDDADGDGVPDGPKESAIRFVFRPRIIGFFVMSLTPLLICGYFMTYLFPIIGTDFGLSDSVLSYAFMITGMCALCLGTPLTEVFTRRNIRHFGLAVSAFLYAGAFLYIAIMQNTTSLIIALILIGIADSFGIPLMSSYFTELDEVEKFGYDRGFGVYSLFENGAQALASFVLGIVYDIGVNKGFITLSMVVAILSTVFFITASIGKKRHEKKIEKESVE